MSTIKIASAVAVVVAASAFVYADIREKSAADNGPVALPKLRELADEFGGVLQGVAHFMAQAIEQVRGPLMPAESTVE